MHNARYVMFRVSLVGGLALLLVACGGMPRADRPAQVEDRTPSTAVDGHAVVGGETQIAAYTPPAQPRYARPEPRRAVAVLINRAADQQKAGDLDAAAVSLERALRIAPDDAVLWHRLARVRAEQARHPAVVQLAAKSNALANPADHTLLNDNWKLIAGARRAMGDVEGARAAERRVQGLR